ncbi:NADPH-dependent methylglyoxal reductase GRE2 [Apiospora arundinis]|uniref:NADPH-dependent methylglyoxal reductase GRE2 n=1 Tax=Apiospora arundinis TaxID=335852 RepID=A0ABR2JIS2_9PEZI
MAELNTSKQRIRNLMTGASRNGCPPTGNHLLVDVRDLALGHALAAGRRFVMVGGRFSNKEIAEIMAAEFPKRRSRLPTGKALEPGDHPSQGCYGSDNTKSKRVLGMAYRPLRESVVDAVTSLQRFLA